MALQNCITEAFDLGEYPGEAMDFFISPNRSSLEQLKNFMEPLSRSVREAPLGDSESLSEGEWLIVLFGPFPTKYDYEHLPAEYDYHFIYKKGDKWFHRDGKGAPITPVDSEELFKYFKSKKVIPQYFAVKRVEGYRVISSIITKL